MPKRKALSFEQFERREMMTGNSISLHGGVLAMDCDDVASVVTYGAGQIRAQCYGVSSNHLSFETTDTVVNKIKITAAAVSTFIFDATKVNIAIHLMDSPHRVPEIDFGSGAFCSAQVIDGDVAIFGTHNRDQVQFCGKVTGNVSIDLKPLNEPTRTAALPDSLRIFGVDVGGDLSIGGSNVQIGQLRVGGNLSIDSGSAPLDLQFDGNTRVNGNTTIRSRHENDRIDFVGRYFRFDGNLTIQTQNGDDKIEASERAGIMIGGEFKFIGGQGEDDASEFLDAASVDGAIRLMDVEIS